MTYILLCTLTVDRQVGNNRATEGSWSRWPSMADTVKRLTKCVWECKQNKKMLFKTHFSPIWNRRRKQNKNRVKYSIYSHFSIKYNDKKYSVQSSCNLDLNWVQNTSAIWLYDFSSDCTNLNIVVVTFVCPSRSYNKSVPRGSKWPRRLKLTLIFVLVYIESSYWYIFIICILIIM